MNSRIYVLLTYFFVVTIIHVTGNNDMTQYWYGNPPRESRQPIPTRYTGNVGQPTRSIGNVGQPSRSTGNVGQPSRSGSVGQNPPPNYDYSLVTNQINANDEWRPPVYNGYGPLNREASHIWYQHPPPELQPADNVGQSSRSIPVQIRPDYDHTLYRKQMNVNAKLPPNGNNNDGSLHNREASHIWYQHPPPELQPSMLQPADNVGQSSQLIPVQIRPDYDHTRYNKQMNVNAKLPPNGNSNDGSVRNRDTSRYNYRNRQPQPTRPVANAGQGSRSTGSVGPNLRTDYGHSRDSKQQNMNNNVGSTRNRDTSSHRYQSPPRELRNPPPTQPIGNVGQPPRSIPSPNRLADDVHSRVNKQMNVNDHLPVNLSNKTDDTFVNIYLNTVFASPPKIDGIKLHITNTSFEFGFEEKNIGAPLKMNISFILSKNVHRGLVLLGNNLKDRHSDKSFEIRRPNLSDETDYKVATVEWPVTGEPHPLYVYVQLYNQSGLCSDKKILEGIVFRNKLGKNNSGHAHGSICLYGSKCQIEVDLKKECAGAEITNTTNNTIIIIICGSILAIVLIVLVIVAYFKRCWIKLDSPKKYQEPITLPFYVNLLFRKECQDIIDDLEQNHYELID